MKPIMLVFIILILSHLPPTVKAQDTQPGDLQKLYTCSMNKSESLMISLQKQDGELHLILDIKNFLGTQRELLNLRVSKYVQYGNSKIMVVDQGRSGYLLLRAEENHVPTEVDHSTVLVQMDNYLFGQEHSSMYTEGHLRTLDLCQPIRN